MARKSRKLSNIMPITAASQNRSAIYLRLSMENNGQNNTDSIENQQKYIEDNLSRFDDINVVKIFSDNGFSGTNFKRDGWQVLFKELQNNNINCVIVKDFSRLGRNIVECANLIESVFPFMNVRFISINDNFDSSRERLSHENLIIGFKSLMNEFYSRDISKKIIAGRNARRKEGFITTSHIPYGYKLSEDKRQLVINDETAPVVKKIFEWRLSGARFSEIIKRLNTLAVPSPGQYLCLSGKGYKKFANSSWSYSNLRHILSDKNYTGDLIQNITNTRIFEGKKHKKTSENEWDIRENAHSALVSKEDFEKIQLIAKRPRHLSKEKNHLVSKVKCGLCGYRMIRTSGKNKKYWSCQSHERQHKERCDTHTSEKIITDIVISALNKYSELTVEHLKIADKIYKSEIMKKHINDIDKRIFQLNNNLEKVGLKMLNLYNDLKNQIITKDEYKAIRNSYTDQHSELKENILKAEKERSKLCDTNRFKRKLNKIISETFDIKNIEFIFSLVDEIIVFPQKIIEVKFNFQNDFAQLDEFIRQWEGII